MLFLDAYFWGNLAIDHFAAHIAKAHRYVSTRMVEVGTVTVARHLVYAPSLFITKFVFFGGSSALPFAWRHSMFLIYPRFRCFRSCFLLRIFVVFLTPRHQVTRAAQFFGIFTSLS